jgi:hypothetical protein
MPTGERRVDNTRPPARETLPPSAARRQKIDALLPSAVKKLTLVLVNHLSTPAKIGTQMTA